MSLEAVQNLMTQVNQLGEKSQMANPDGNALQQNFLILTEMNRTFRLLGTDIAFLQAARKSLTVQHRQRQMAAKIQRLSAFCEALMKTLMV